MRTPLDEEQQQKVRKSLESLAILAFRYVKDKYHANTGRKDECYSIASLRDTIFSKRMGNEQSNRDYYLVLEAINLLERRGLVVRDLPGNLGSFGDSHFDVYITSIGIKSNIGDEVLLLVDRPEEIIGKLEGKIGKLDPVVRQYYIESLRGYQEGLYTSSVICLGVASERAIHWLAESIDSYSARYQKPIKEGRYWNIDRLIKDLIDTVIPNIFKGDKKFKQKLEKRLKGLGDIYRENRNEAGHPDTVDQSWSREEQKELLSLFGIYISTISQAIGKCSKSD